MKFLTEEYMKVEREGNLEKEKKEYKSNMQKFF